MDAPIRLTRMCPSETALALEREIAGAVFERALQACWARRACSRQRLVLGGRRGPNAFGQGRRRR